MKALSKYIESPRSFIANLDLAAWYEEQEHYAGAVSHYLRCVEFGDQKKHEYLIYNCLIRLGLCFRAVGNISYQESAWFLMAISFNPKRPEAYLYMSMFHEAKGQHHEAYTYAVMGLACSIKSENPDTNFLGEYALIFQKAVCAWWIGRTKESRQLFFSMPDKYEMTDEYKGYVQNNLSSLGSGHNPFIMYDKSKHARLRYAFPGSDTIEKNYSQTYQDMFVLSMLDGKKKGYYLEIGSADPFKGNNTYLLESEFAWTGVSIEIKEELVQQFRQRRKNKVVCMDALAIDYHKFLTGIGAPDVIDYLQLDCEPPETTFNILLSLPFSRFTFGVITFEHDYYADAYRKFRDLSRQFLMAQGYVMVVGDIAPDHKSNFEDWWVHSSLIKPKTLKRMFSLEKGVQFVEDYMLTPEGKELEL